MDLILDSSPRAPESPWGACLVLVALLSWAALALTFEFCISVESQHSHLREAKCLLLIPPSLRGAKYHAPLYKLGRVSLTAVR
jgi:hypothetical protein